MGAICEWTCVITSLRRVTPLIRRFVVGIAIWAEFLEHWRLVFFLFRLKPLGAPRTDHLESPGGVGRVFCKIVDLRGAAAYLWFLNGLKREFVHQCRILSVSRRK